MSDPTPTAPRRRLLRIGAACAVLLALACYMMVRLLPEGAPTAARCTVRGPGKDAGHYEMDPEQAVNAATIEAVGSSRGLSERAVTIALATAMQESGLRNIQYGDRDSLGLFQQRPSQGWGDTEHILDPVYSAGKFYDHLLKVPGYSRLPLTVAAQKVQKSGFPQAYAKHEPDAALLASALTGRSAAMFNCTTASAAQHEPGDPARVRAKLVREFGPRVLPRTETGTGIGDPGRNTAALGEETSAGSGKSRHGKDPVISVPVDGRTERGGRGRRGWEVAHWAVAHSSELRIAQVSYAGRVWSAENSGKGWQRSETDSAGEKNADSATVAIRTEQ